MGWWAVLLILLFCLTVLVVILLIRRHFLPQMTGEIHVPFLPVNSLLGPETEEGLRVLVTGSNGFVGRHLVERLLGGKNYGRIFCCDFSTPIFVNRRCVNFRIDLTREELVENLFKYNHFDVVFHIAGVVDTRNGPRYVKKLQANPIMARNICNALSKYSNGRTKLISLSSSSVGVEQSAYGVSKRQQQEIISSFGGMSLRPWKVYGDGDTLGTDHFRTQPPTVIMPAKKTGLCYVKNLVHLLESCQSHYFPGEILDVGDPGLTLSYREFVVGILQASGRSISPICIPDIIGVTLAHVTPWIDSFVTLCLGGRTAPLSLGLMLNPVVWNRLSHDPGDGWNVTVAKQNVERLGGVPFSTWQMVLEDLASVWKTPERDRFPRINHLPTSEPLQVMQSAKIGPLILSSRTVKTATFEASCDEQGRIMDRLIDFHVANASVGLTTVAYGAISPGGRSFPNQLVVRPESGLKRLVDAVHSAGGKISLQLTHAGYFALDPQGPRSWMFDPMHFAWAKAANVEQIVKDFAEAARVAEEAGFDAVTIHAGHGYLLSQFLSSDLNRRTDKYGSDRALLCLEVLRAVRKTVTKTAVLLKFNLVDQGGPGSEEVLKERVAFIRRVQEESLVDGLIPSGGLVLGNGFFMLRGEARLWHMIRGSAALVTRLALLLVGPFVVNGFPYREAFFWDAVDYLVKSGKISIPIIYTGGVHHLETAEFAVRHRFAVGMARALLNDPNLIQHWKMRNVSHQKCDANNRCASEAAFYNRPPSCILNRETEW